MIASIVHFLGSFPGYTAAEIFFYFLGCCFWLWAYAVLIIKTKDKFVEMPMFVAAANVAWEFVFGFIFDLGLGGSMQWLYRIGCLMDIYILFNVYRYGHKEISTPEIRQYFKPILIAIFLIWGIFVYLFKEQGYDLPLGSHSAYLINFPTSILYIINILRTQYIQFYSIQVGLGKMFGTGFISVFCFIKYPENFYIMASGILCFVLDGIYMILLIQRKKKARLTNGRLA